MEYKIRKYPMFSACGLNCGLCPRFYTDGPSRCPGCGGEGFTSQHCGCGMLSCCQRKGLEYCFECDEFPCKKYTNIDPSSSDSFITHRNQFIDMEKAKCIGLLAYEAELNEKVSILESLLTLYNDGRKKSFYCLVTNLLDLTDIKTVIGKIENEVKPDMSQKEKSAIATKLFNEMAGLRGVSLKLRK